MRSKQLRIANQHAEDWHQQSRTTEVFSSSKYTLVPKHRFHGNNDLKDIEKALNVSAVISNRCSTSISVHDVSRSSGYYLRSTHGNDKELSLSEVCVTEAMKNVTQLTYSQTEDPVLFVLRAFKFTSRTSSAFIRLLNMTSPDILSIWMTFTFQEPINLYCGVIWFDFLGYRLTKISYWVPAHCFRHRKQVYAPWVW